MNKPEKNIILPAEWQPQSFVQIAFPHAATDWTYMLAEARRCFGEIIKQILRFENVLAVYADADSLYELQKLKPQDYSKYKLYTINCPLNDTWARDHAGITVIHNGQKTVRDFTFNGWGLKFAAGLDNRITGRIFAAETPIPLLDSFIYSDCRRFILEGGSIESDGCGTILTTEKCLLSDNRNYLSRNAIEDKFKEFFGTERVLWLACGSLAGDDTDSHIDTLARFCNESTIAYVKCEDENDEHFKELNLMENELKNFRQKNGKPYSLQPLPMPDAIFDENGKRLPATYANFLIINGAVLLPVYNSPKDTVAAKTLHTIFPDRKIIEINCLPLINQHGSLHCVTMQFP